MLVHFQAEDIRSRIVPVSLELPSSLTAATANVRSERNALRIARKERFGNSTSLAPVRAASAVKVRTFARVASRSNAAGAFGMVATRKTVIAIQSNRRTSLSIAKSRMRVRRAKQKAASSSCHCFSRNTHSTTVLPSKHSSSGMPFLRLGRLRYSPCPATDT